MMGLTRKQHELLTFMDERIRESGIPPSFEECKDAVGLQSKSGIHRLMTSLESRGYIRRQHRSARAIEIVQLPPNTDRRAPVSREQVRSGAISPSPRQDATIGAVSIPLVGRIGNHTPIEALQNKILDVPVPAGMVGKGCYYALEILGDALINAGILDGDTVIVQETDKCASGEIVIALIDRSVCLARRLRRRSDCIALEAANPAYETHLYYPDRIKIQGRICGLVRRY